MLQKAASHGVRSLLIVRGDAFESPPQSDQIPCFQFASDLVRFIRKQFGDMFCIGVAGYPSGARDNESVEDSLRWLKLKVKLGAQFVITQAVYNAEEFDKFVQICRQEGLTVPIIAGILPINSYKTWQLIRKLGRIHIPIQLEQQIEVHKDDDRTIADLSLKHCVQAAQKIVSSDSTSCVHLFMLNNAERTLKLINSIDAFRGERPTSFNLPQKVIEKRIQSNYSPH